MLTTIAALVVAKLCLLGLGRIIGLQCTRPDPGRMVPAVLLSMGAVAGLYVGAAGLGG